MKRPLRGAVLSFLYLSKICFELLSPETIANARLDREISYKRSHIQFLASTGFSLRIDMTSKALPVSRLETFPTHFILPLILGSALLRHCNTAPATQSSSSDGVKGEAMTKAATEGHRYLWLIEAFQ